MEHRAFRDVEQFFHERIPLTRAMGLRVLWNARNVVALEAPVALNHNHLHAAFGGSINAVATLAGYGMLWLELGETAQLVISASSIRFLQPVRETIRAVCLQPVHERMQAFRNEFEQNGKARIALTVRVEEDDRLAAEFEGTFVATKKTPDPE